MFIMKFIIKTRTTQSIQEIVIFIFINITYRMNVNKSENDTFKKGRPINKKKI